MNGRWFRWGVILVPALIGLACSSAPEPPPLEFGTAEIPPKPEAKPRHPVINAGQFPCPEALEPQVAFWRKVYAQWMRSQAVVHDDRYLNLVYEVLDLPGDIAESYTPDQKALVDERREFWRDRLRSLALHSNSGWPLTPEDESLQSRIRGEAGDGGLSGAAERVRVQRGLRERFKRGLEISGRYDRLFRRIFRDAGLPEDLAYLPHVESSFQAAARSSAGAVGIWQFTRSAAKVYMDLDLVGDQRLDPIASAHGAARYLNSAHSKLGSWPLALTSYNHGIAGMRRARDSLGHDLARIVQEYDHPKFGFASRNFYAEFLAAREIASQPERFFPEGIRYEASLEHEEPVSGYAAQNAEAPRFD